MQIFEEIGEGCLYLGSCGQKIPDEWYSCPIVKQNRPPSTGVVDSSYLSKYDGTKFYQWFGRKSDGRWYPFGKILKLKKAIKSKKSA